MISYDEVIIHVEKSSGIPKANFLIASNAATRAFAHIDNVNGEAVFERMKSERINSLCGLNGSGLKRDIKNRFGFIFDTVEKGNHGVISKFKIIGIEKTFAAANTPSITAHIRKELDKQPCQISGTFANCEYEHPFAYHLYQDETFRNNINSYRRLQKPFNNIWREVVVKCRKSGLKPDNRDKGCQFYTTYGNIKYNEIEATISQPFRGMWWEGPKAIHQQDQFLFREYFKRFSNQYNIDDFTAKIIPAINELIMSDANVRVENIDDTIKKLPLDPHLGDIAAGLKAIVS